MPRRKGGRDNIDDDPANTASKRHQIAKESTLEIKVPGTGQTLRASKRIQDRQQAATSSVQTTPLKQPPIAAKKPSQDADTVRTVSETKQKSVMKVKTTIAKAIDVEDDSKAVKTAKTIKKTKAVKTVKAAKTIGQNEDDDDGKEDDDDEADSTNSRVNPKQMLKTNTVVHQNKYVLPIPPSQMSPIGKDSMMSRDIGSGTRQRKLAAINENPELALESDAKPPRQTQQLFNQYSDRQQNEGLRNSFKPKLFSELSPWQQQEVLRKFRTPQAWDQLSPRRQEDALRSMEASSHGQGKAGKEISSTPENSLLKSMIDHGSSLFQARTRGKWSRSTTTLSPRTDRNQPSAERAFTWNPITRLGTIAPIQELDHDHLNRRVKSLPIWDDKRFERYATQTRPDDRNHTRCDALIARTIILFVALVTGFLLSKFLFPSKTTTTTYCALNDTSAPFPAAYNSAFTIPPLWSPEIKAQMSSYAESIGADPWLLDNCILPQEIQALPLVTCQQRLPWYNLTVGQVEWLNEKSGWSAELDFGIVEDFNRVFGMAFEVRELQVSWMMSPDGPSSSSTTGNGGKTYREKRCQACVDLNRELEYKKQKRNWWKRGLFGLGMKGEKKPAPKRNLTRYDIALARASEKTSIESWSRILEDRDDDSEGKESISTTSKEQKGTANIVEKTQTKHKPRIDMPPGFENWNGYVFILTWILLLSLLILATFKIAAQFGTVNRFRRLNNVIPGIGFIDTRRVMLVVAAVVAFFWFSSVIAALWRGKEHWDSVVARLSKEVVQGSLNRTNI